MFPLPPAEIWLPGTMAMMCLTFASAFFSSSETALFFLSHDELRTFRAGKLRERVVAKLLADPDRLLTAVLFWNLLVNLTYFAVSVIVTQSLVQYGSKTSAGAFGVLSIVWLILFGEAFPKIIAVAYRRQLAVLFCIPLAALVRIFDPIAPFMARLTRRIRRVFWPHVVQEPFFDTADLERAVEASAHSTEVIRQERQILKNILGLSTIRIEEIMRPRGTYQTRPEPVQLSDLRGEVPAGDYLLITIRGTDDIEKAIPLADLTQVSSSGLAEAMEDVVHVPWCANVANTLQLLRDQFCGVAVVVNEYGATIGVVTHDDLIDTFLLPEPSRARRVLRREPIIEVQSGEFIVEGITTLRFLCRRFNLEYEPDSDGLVTVAGMLQAELEHLPTVGDVCNWRGFRFEVIEAENRGRLKCRVTSAPTSLFHRPE